MIIMITRQQQPPLESFKVITNIEYRGLMMNGENVNNEGAETSKNAPF